MADDERIERFDGLVDVFKHHEAERARRLQVADKTAATERARLEQIDNVRGEYRADLEGAQRNGIAATALKNWRRFMHGLERVHVEQSGRVARAEDTRTTRHGEWLQLHRRVKGFEHLTEGLREAARNAAHRFERKLMDEIGGRRSGERSSSMLKGTHEDVP